jgi:hypothetical protein
MSAADHTVAGQTKYRAHGPSTAGCGLPADQRDFGIPCASDAREIVPSTGPELYRERARAEIVRSPPTGSAVGDTPVRPVSRTEGAGGGIDMQRWNIVSARSPKSVVGSPATVFVGFGAASPSCQWRCVRH